MSDNILILEGNLSHYQDKSTDAFYISSDSEDMGHGTDILYALLRKFGALKVQGAEFLNHDFGIFRITFKRVANTWEEWNVERLKDG